MLLLNNCSRTQIKEIHRKDAKGAKNIFFSGGFTPDANIKLMSFDITYDYD